MRSALVLGATGLIGGELIPQLLGNAEYGLVRALVRRPLGRTHPKLQAVTVSFDALEAHAEAFAVDDIYCALGTTVRKSGSQEQYRKIDVEYPSRAAVLGKRAGARNCLLVTAMGANPGSSLFYNRIKGEAEEGVKAAGLAATHIFRPSFLIGDRQEHRPLERAALPLLLALNWALVGPLRPYRAIHAATVARAMIRAALSDADGLHVYPSDRIAQLGAQS